MITLLTLGSVLLLPAYPVHPAPSENHASYRLTNDPVEALRSFLAHLASGNHGGAYAHVAPSTKREGDPICYRVKVDYDNFLKEVSGRPGAKFAAYRFGKVRQEADGRIRVWVHFNCGDNDEALIVREGGWWYVADPIHIIR
jgi:hypothetical protein